MQRLTIANRLILAAAAAMLCICVALLLSTRQSYWSDAQEHLRDRAAVFTAFADSTKSYLAELHEADVFDHEQLVTDAHDDGLPFSESVLYRSMPIVSGWTTARRVAEQEGLEFQIVAFDARNQDHEPSSDPVAGEFRAQLLRDLTATAESGGDQTVARIDEEHGRLHFLRAIVLEKGCMQCHGDPATSPSGDGLDITGARMEGWRVGDVHGAYELTMPLAPVHARVASFTWQALACTAPLLVCTLLLFVWVLRRQLARPMRELTQTLGELAAGDGDLTRRLQVHRDDEVGLAAKQFNRFADKIRETIVGTAAVCRDADANVAVVKNSSQTLSQAMPTPLPLPSA